jgi:hypothetical protein
MGSTVVSAAGTLRWQRGTTDGGHIPVVADLDLDGAPEVVLGSRAYRGDGTLFWTSAVTVPTESAGQFVAVGNFDADPNPEIVVSVFGNLYSLEHTGAIKWGPVPVPGGARHGNIINGSVPPTIADMDDDGRPDIGVSGCSTYVVFSETGTIKWQVNTFPALPDRQSSTSKVTALPRSSIERSSLFGWGMSQWRLHKFTSKPTSR